MAGEQVYSAAQVPRLLFRAVHGAPPWLDSNTGGSGGTSDPSSAGDDVVERVDLLDAWRRVPNGPLKRLYWQAVVEGKPLGTAARANGFTLAEATPAIQAGSRWIAGLLNDKRLV